MELTVEQALQQGVAGHKEGNLQEAERLYRAILQSQPTHPDANHNLGVLLVSVNKADVGLPLFKIALEANPKIEQFWVSYIDALVKNHQLKDAKQAIRKAKKKGFDAKKLQALLSQSRGRADTRVPSEERLSSLLECYQNGRSGDAEKLAKSITEEFPANQFAWKVLGAVLKQTGRISESLAASKKSVQLSPQDAEARSNLGITLQELGRLDEAETNYRQAIALKADFAEAHSNLGNALQVSGRLNEAEASCRQAISLKPDFPESHSNLGITLDELGRLDEAEESYERAIALKPEYAEAHYNLGNTLKELGRLDKAEASYRQAIVLKPGFAEAHSNLGVTLQVLGKLDEAEESHKQAVTLKPDYAEAHRHLALMKKFDVQDEQYSKMLELYLDENISEEQRCHINFGLAKACEDLEDFEKAFAHYSEGNVLRKKLLNYDVSQDFELFKQIKSNYPRIVQNPLEPDKLPMNSMPIFIVGMPRSGTTLVEQIISSHSQVTGAGELSFVTQFGAAIAGDFSKVNDESLLSFRDKYLTKLKSVSNGKLIVTDKMPQNFRYIGLLAAVFPEAKIVHVKRNPAAVCWANYKQHFASKAIGYCYALEDVVSYHRLYEDLMEFWRNSLNKRIYNLDYELLVKNQESETRQLISYLGLDWDEKCMSPQNNIRNVETASSLQVRKKVYQGSSQQWKKYEPFLKGAFDELIGS